MKYRYGQVEGSLQLRVTAVFGSNAGFPHGGCGDGQGQGQDTFSHKKLHSFSAVRLPVCDRVEYNTKGVGAQSRKRKSRRTERQRQENKRKKNCKNAQGCLRERGRRREKWARGKETGGKLVQAAKNRQFPDQEGNTGHSALFRSCSQNSTSLLLII